MDRAYRLFQEALLDIRRFKILSYTSQAQALFQAWRQQKIRIGSHDLRIAAICVTHGATLISRNRRDYAQVPTLAVEFWG